LGRACHELLKQHICGLACCFWCGYDEPDLIGLLRQIEGEERAAGLLIAHHFADMVARLRRIAQIENQIATFVGA
jgi:hypothetical protein